MGALLLKYGLAAYALQAAAGFLVVAIPLWLEGAPEIAAAWAPLF